MICLLMKCYVLYCNATQQCNHCKRRPYTRVMRRSRRTYTLAMGEWTAGNHDQAGHRSERSHSVRVEFMHAHPSPPMEVEWSYLCVSTKADDLSAYIYNYVYMDVQHSLFTK